MRSHLIQQKYYEVRPEELTSSPDVTECEQFYQQTCGCNKDHRNPCSKQFTLEHCIQRRAQCSFLTKDELDLVSMDFISSVMMDTEVVKDGRHHNTAVLVILLHYYSPFCMELERIASKTSKITARKRAYKHMYTKTLNALLTMPCHAMPFNAATSNAYATRYYEIPWEVVLF